MISIPQHTTKMTFVLPQARRTTKNSTKKAPIQETKVPLLPIADGGIVSLNAKTSNLATSTIVTVSTEDGALGSEVSSFVRVESLYLADHFLSTSKRESST